MQVCKFCFAKLESKKQIPGCEKVFMYLILVGLCDLSQEYQSALATAKGSAFGLTIPLIGHGLKRLESTYARWQQAIRKMDKRGVKRHETLFYHFNGGAIHMARISGVDLPREKRVEIGLTYIYGIGRVTSNRILAQANVNPDTRVRDLTDEEVARIRDVIDETVTVEGDLRREIALNIKRLQEIGCYRGIRHRKGLPVRGQKTKNNARTRKGPRRTVANKKK